MISYEIFEQDLDLRSELQHTNHKQQLKLYFYFDEEVLFKVGFEKDVLLKATYLPRPTFIKEFKEFFIGKKPFNYRQISLKGTPFQIAVWKQIIGIPRGKTLSYGEIAERIGRPQAYRAVGTAVGKNNFGVIVPCHRVLHTGKNKVGKFGGGENIKKALLHHEGVILPD